MNVCSYLRASVLALFILHPSSLILHPSPVWADDKPARKEPPGPRVFKGRVIAPVMTAEGGGAEWLERRDRDETEQPEKVLDALKIPPGSTVADVGAGTGYFSLRIAKRVGPKGSVLATDVQPEMIRLLTENAKKAGLKNVEPVLCTDADAKLPAGQVDLALMVDVYHEFQDPEQAMAQVRRSLKPDGRLVLVEYRGEDPTVPIKEVHKTTLRQVRYEIEPMGFRLVDSFEFLVHQHVEVFVKDDCIGDGNLIDVHMPAVRPSGGMFPTSEQMEAAGFVRLFSGKALSGWEGDPKIWQVRSGVLTGHARDGSSARTLLRTEERFDDFEFDVQWRAADPEASCHIAVRASVLPDGSVVGHQATIGVGQHGGASDPFGAEWLLPPRKIANFLVDADGWNRTTIRCEGDHGRIALNGLQTGEFKLDNDQTGGPIVLMPQRASMEFREIWIRRLKP